ncbi:glycine betaine ABC transporter substrate-binding protein [Cellulomonas sp. PhB143]|uniref:glycine betaine ABC transporter substrate-binding protein n=1 Tax=Cellulomonas sp. PhB143 TaxID=2485186 RepID=UPI000F4884FE|nr:glycine betaine ABC transporter substrate-binding protein [Cellulomonas sp. PhB143]ROS78531.1 glycine betaine/proline transport system substrate-binding protein [Cellulomonas sp. PhB143]
MVSPRTRTYARRTLAIGTALILVVGLVIGSRSSDGGGSGAKDEKIAIGVPTGWDEGIAASYLWATMLEDQGYDVETQDADLGVIFTGLAGGGYDLYFDTWLPTTHKAYIDKYGDDIVDLGTWYDQAKLTIAVNEDSPAKTIGDLKTMGDEYGNKLVGIEAGAGETGVIKNDVLPGYGLDNIDFPASSTSAMLASLKGATDKGENIAVEMWRPHWAYDAFPIRDLKDPKGLMGKTEKIHTYGDKTFAKDHPDLVGPLKKFRMSDDQLFSLENLLTNDYQDDKEAGVQKWLKANPDFESSIFGS